MTLSPRRLCSAISNKTQKRYFSKLIIIRKKEKKQAGEEKSKKQLKKV